MYIIKNQGTNVNFLSKEFPILTLSDTEIKKDEVYVFYSDFLDYTAAINLENSILENGSYLITIMFDNPFILIGPMSYKNTEYGCLECGYQRRIQHTNNPDLYQEIIETKKQYPIKNKLNNNNRKIIKALLNTIKSNNLDLRGTMLVMNMFTKENYKSRIINIHNCSKCGLEIEEERRSYKFLAEKFSNQKGGVLNE